MKGRPKTGQLRAVFRRHDEEITSVKYDLSQANGGVIASVGQDTIVGFTLTPNQPFPIGERYDAVLYLNQTKLGTYPFKIVAPAGATASKISKTLVVSSDSGPAVGNSKAKFGANEKVAQVGRGDFGKHTWIQAEWLVAGKRDSNATRSLTFQKNLTNQRFRFSFAPNGGWPEGKHKVVLTMNDHQAVAHEFMIE